MPLSTARTLPLCYSGVKINNCMVDAAPQMPHGDRTPQPVSDSASAAWPSAAIVAPAPRAGGPTLIREAVFTVLDLETTGGSPPEHRVTEIAVHRIENLQITSEFSTLVNPQRNVPGFVSNLTGITNQMLTGKPTVKQVARELLEFLGDSVLVAHHSEFDRKFLNNELRLARKPALRNADLCTCKLARRILPWLPSKSLGSLADYFGIHCAQRHRAAADALASAKLLLIFLNYLQHRGLSTLDEVLAFQHGDLAYKR